MNISDTIFIFANQTQDYVMDVMDMFNINDFKTKYKTIILSEPKYFKDINIKNLETDTLKILLSKPCCAKTLAQKIYNRYKNIHINNI